MDQENLNLKWHTYSGHLETMMKEMIMNDDFTDVTLITEDKKQIKSHKNILSASSPVFKSILKTEQLSNPIIFLRGIQSFELESLLKFIHLGKVKFHKDRMTEFLNVARSLEIKGLSKEEIEQNIVQENNEVKPTSIHQTPSNIDGASREVVVENSNVHQGQNSNEGPLNTNKSLFYEGKGLDLTETNKTNYKVINGKYECEYYEVKPTSINQTPSNIDDARSEVVGEKTNVQPSQKTIEGPLNTFYEGKGLDLNETNKSNHKVINGRYECEYCPLTAISIAALSQHINSVHKGVRYNCSQCDKNFTSKYHLKRHVKVKHVGVRFPCNQCDFQATSTWALRLHVKSKHDVLEHTQSQHESAKWPCELCKYQASQEWNLRRHIKNKHKIVQKNLILESNK